MLIYSTRLSQGQQNKLFAMTDLTNVAFKKIAFNGPMPKQLTSNFDPRLYYVL